MPFWSPQPGPQTRAFTCPCDLILYGGARGGGKTDTALGRQIYGAEKYREHWNGIMFRRKYKDFAEIRRRLREFINNGLPARLVGGDNQVNVLRFDNKALVTLMSLEHPDALADHQGQQYTEISIEEATNFPFIADVIDRMKGCLRSAHKGIQKSIFLTCNPGGPGHLYIKHKFIDPVPPGRVQTDEAGETCVFIPSKVYDNKILMDNDPKFERRLRSISDPVLREAWLMGSWDVYIGQAFAFNRTVHVIQNPPPVPDHCMIYFTYDWGFGAPFSIGWWWIDNDGRLYRFAEWYGWNGVPNNGLRLSDSDVAVGIIERERKMGIAGRKIVRYAGHDCFAKKPDYKSGDQLPSTAETFAEHGLMLVKGNTDRKQRIRQMRERLRIPKDEDGHIIDAPMLRVYPSCTAFIRTIPALCLDDSIEDIEDEQEDHVYDETGHIIMARPIRGSHALYAGAGVGANLTEAARESLM